jgi:hypothetical protein
MGLPNGYVGTCRGSVLTMWILMFCSTDVQYMYVLLGLVWKASAVTSKSMTRAS